MAIDKKKYFLNPVTVEEAPDYNTIIAQSMCFSEIYQKMTSHQYTELDQFINDISLIWQNSMDYNAADTYYYKVAMLLKKASKTLFEKAIEQMSRFQLKGGMWDEPVDEAIFDYIREEEEEIAVIEDEPTIEPTLPQDIQLVNETHKLARIEKAKLIQEKDKVSRTLRTRTDSPDELLKQNIPTTQTLNEVHEHYIQSLNISNDQNQQRSYKQINTSNYFAEQQLLEQKRKEKREQNRVLEEAKLQEQGEKMEQPAKKEDPLLIQVVNQNYEPVQPTQEKVNIKKRKEIPRPSRPSRLTRSAGLQASIQELTKRPKISHEARALFASYNGVSHLDKPVEIYKENRKKSAPVGWVYVDEEEEGRHSSDEDVSTSRPRPKYVKRKRNAIPIPNFKRGEIVWARVTGYPSHPAKFLNLSDEETPPKILASRRFTGDVLVEFLQVPENHKW